MSNIPLILPRLPILASDDAKWKNINLAQWKQPPYNVPQYISMRHTVCINVGKPVRLEQKVDGRCETVYSLPGDLAIYPAYLCQQFCWDKEVEFLNLFLSPSFLDTVARDVFESDRIELIPQLTTIADPLIQQMGFALKTSLEIDGTNSSIYAESMAHVLAVHLLLRYSTNSRPVKNIIGGLTQQQLKQIVDFIYANLDRNITLVELAEIVRLSPFHFAHLFKKSTGISPHQYLISSRIERAKQLLLLSNFSIAEVAQITGFASQGHFTYHFKRLVGVTPKIFCHDRKNV